MKKELSNVIKEWKTEAGVKSAILVNAYSSTKKTLTICTDKPGLMIGKQGVVINKYLEKIKEVAPNVKNIEFVQTDKWYIK